jgi:hypothetical protein
MAGSYGQQRSRVGAVDEVRQQQHAVEGAVEGQFLDAPLDRRGRLYEFEHRRRLINRNDVTAFRCQRVSDPTGAAAQIQHSAPFA